ncbi:MAG: type II toxin-antitoxin system death-on-curing family toxin [Coriobacteriia bacterium]|nr:type II toxin-antitoxin system death-on-curing family toxin [Coriobacteriia bacterium]
MNSQESSSHISSEDDYLWIDVQEADALHDMMLRADGGLPGTRDQAALESALSRPTYKYLYSEEPPSLATLAAAYGFGIATSHPYNDANKRTAFTVMNTFLLINGARIKACQEDVVRVMRLLAMGKIDEEGLTIWLEEHLVAHPS